MSDTPAPAPSTQTVVVAPSMPSPRWISLVTVILGIMGTTGVVVGALLTIGAWRAQVDVSIADLKQRMNKAEENQRTYIPILIGLSKDVTYLAERARREDERRDREGR